jgi:hypothetical protein
MYFFKKIVSIPKCLLTLLILVTAFLGYTRLNIERIGNQVGETKGQIVGTAVGSVNGIIEGRAAGKEAGEADGLSAEDTEVDIKGTIESIGKLEVLVARVKLKNTNKLGLGDEYENLTIFGADAVFTVDLSAAKISYGSNGQDVYISIGEPTLDLYVDLNSSETLFEVQKFSWTVTAEDGINARLNSMKKTVSNVKETMANYDTLMDMAKESAKEQVQLLTSTVCGNGVTVHVQFK